MSFNDPLCFFHNVANNVLVNLCDTTFYKTMVKLHLFLISLSQISGNFLLFYFTTTCKRILITGAVRQRCKKNPYNFLLCMWLYREVADFSFTLSVDVIYQHFMSNQCLDPGNCKYWNPARVAKITKSNYPTKSLDSECN